MGKDVNQKISVGEEVFYTQYKCIADSSGGMVLVVSPNLEIRLTENKFNFKIQTSLKEVSLDARFLLGLKSTNSFAIEGPVSYTHLDVYKRQYQNRAGTHLLLMCVSALHYPL